MDDPLRARILVCAQEVFANEGFRSAEVKTIAVQACVGKASIYKSFSPRKRYC